MEVEMGVRLFCVGFVGMILMVMSPGALLFLHFLKCFCVTLVERNTTVICSIFVDLIKYLEINSMRSCVDTYILL